MNNTPRFLKVLLLSALLSGAALPVSAGDWGLVLRQDAVINGGGASSLEYTGTALPWFAMPLGDRADLYLSGGLSAEYADKEWKPLPEIHRFQVTCDPTPDVRIEAGRVPFTAYAVMAGLFDGASFRVNTGGGRLGGGLFYTGLLYKKAAAIVMTGDDRTSYNDKDGYFASRRIAAGVDWEYTGIFNTRGTLAAGAAAQFDVNGGDSSFHSQYLQVHAGIPLGGRFNAGLGGVFQLTEETDGSWAAFALSADLQWMLPTALEDRLSVNGWFGSGKWSDRSGPFIPITTQARGKVLSPDSPGIALLEAAYTARIGSRLAADISGAYYFRTDKVSFQKTGMDALSDSPLLGGELYGGVTWAPFSDVLVSAGGGVFLPWTGKVFTGGTAPIYRAALDVSISL
jgi:hypothetical protein